VNLQTVLSWSMYLGILVIGTLSMWYAQKLYKDGSRNYWWLLAAAFLVLTLPVALRSASVGFDTAEYNEYYYTLIESGKFSFRDNLEPIYQLFMYIAVQVGHPHVVFLLAAPITFFFMLAGIWYLRDQLNLGLVMFMYLCFFYLQTFNVVRQCFAIALIFFALRFVCERKFLLYLLFVILAYQMHSSAIIALFLYPLAAEKLSPKMRKLLNVLAVSAVLFVLSPLLGPALRWVVSIDVFAAYRNHIAAEGSVGSSWIIRAVFIVGAIFLCETFRTEKNVRSAAMFATSLSLPFLVVSYISAPVGRVGAFFSIFNIITFASFAGRKSEKPILPKLENAIMVAFSLLTYLMSLYSNGLLLIPYSTFFAA